MSQIHSNPDAHGMLFGKVVVTVDVMAGDCVIRAPKSGSKTFVDEVRQTRRFHSLDEMRGAYAAQMILADKGDSVAGDIARALKFAGQQLQAKRKRR